MTLETERLVVRPTELRDVDDVYAYSADPDVMKYRACGVLDRDQTARDVTKIVESGQSYPHFVGRVHQIVLKSTNRVIGYCYLDKPWPQGYRDLLTDGKFDFADISYGLARAHWGHGYATEAAQVVVRHGFDNAGIAKVGAGVHPQNIASIRVLRRLGLSYRRQIQWPKQGTVDFFAADRDQYIQHVHSRTSGHHVRLLPELVRQIHQACPACGIVVQGSVAEGRQTPDSDIDLFVVLPDGATPAFNHLLCPDNQGRMRRKGPVEGIPLDIGWQFAGDLERLFLTVGAYCFYIFCYGAVISDPAGLAARCQRAGLQWFRNHSDILNAWHRQHEEVLRHKADASYPLRFATQPEFYDHLKRMLEQPYELLGGEP